MSGQDLERWADPSWRDCLVAWWQGYDVDELRQAARVARSQRGRPARAAASQIRVPSPSAASVGGLADEFANAKALEMAQCDARGRPVWSIDRVRGAERLWGRDAVGPDDVEGAIDAVRPFALSPSKTVLDLSAGLGGRARALAGSYDTWVTGLEPSPVLASLAMARSNVAGMANKASVTVYDPEVLHHDGRYDLIIGDRVLHRIRQKEAFLDQLRLYTKGAGTMLIDDYVVEGSPVSWEQWNDWRREEPIEVHPWPRQRLSEELLQRNLDLRSVVDLTPAHRSHILARIRALGDELATSQTPDGGVLIGLERELSLWWNRLRVLGSGLSLFRFEVHKPQE